MSYAFVVAESLGIEQAFKPNIKRYTDMLFEREPLKDLSLISLKRNNVIFNLGDKYDYP